MQFIKIIETSVQNAIKLRNFNLRMKPNSSIMSLFQEIEIMEEELKTKNALIQKHSQLIQTWRGEVKEQLDRHLTELERV